MTGPLLSCVVSCDTGTAAAIGPDRMGEYYKLLNLIADMQAPQAQPPKPSPPDSQQEPK